MRVWTSVCRKTEQERLQNSLKRVDRLHQAYIRRELIPGGGTRYGEWPSAEVGGHWARDQVAVGGKMQPFLASNWCNWLAQIGDYSVSVISKWPVNSAVVCPSLDISTAPTLGRIITELSRPALRAHLTTGDGGLVVQGNPGSEPWRPTCNLWILDWRLRSNALRTDRLGGNSWQRLRRLRHAREEEEVITSPLRCHPRCVVIYILPHKRCCQAVCHWTLIWT